MKRIISLMITISFILSGCISNISSIKQINSEIQKPINWKVSLSDYGNKQIIINRNNKTIDEIIDIICIHSSSMAQGELYSFGNPGSSTSHTDNLESISIVGYTRVSDKEGSTICKLLIVYDYQVRKTSGVEKYRLYLKYKPTSGLSFSRTGYATEDDWNRMNSEAYNIKVNEENNIRKYK